MTVCFLVVCVCIFSGSPIFLCELIRPIVLLQLRVILRVGVFHSDAPRQYGGHVVPNWLPLCLLLLLLLHLLQLDACSKNKACTCFNL